MKSVADPIGGPTEPDPVLAGKRVLIIIENLPAPFDRRVWQQARTLAAAGMSVSIACPTGKGFEKRYEEIEGIAIYRYVLPFEAASAAGYFREYLTALVKQSWLAWKIHFGGGFDVIHACNPPDLICLVALPFKALGKRFIFDHHDINPELYEAKFGRRDTFWRLLLMFERLTFMVADVSIATNDSYRQIAIERGKMAPEDVFVVRSGPDLKRFEAVSPNPKWRNGRRFLVGYVGVMGEQEGIDLLLESVAHLVGQLGRKDIQFCLVGGGSSLEAMKARATALELDDYVTFTGRVPDDELLEVLSTADVCVNPDRVNPMNDLSTMNKIIEYMALGKPIVQFDVKEGRVSARDASLYAAKNDPIDFAAKIVQLIDDEAGRRTMSAIGRSRVERSLSWKNQEESLLSAYRLALMRRRAGRRRSCAETQ